ncbi:MAG: acyl-CoA dehydrogenase [Acidimicrobiales bacterium]|jgi:acyl-CoA dehydrogenase|nr:acyl-CoA dehydrogenase [Acidimicrobiales bacterium]
MTNPVHVDPLITETAHRLFSEVCDHEAVQLAETRGEAPEIWNAFAETGFPWISVDEAAGGSGGSLLDALEVLRVVGYHAAPIPAAETGVLGGWLLAGSGQELPAGIVTVVPNGGSGVSGSVSGDELTVSGRALRVPWARVAERIVVPLEVDGQAVVASIDAKDCHIEPMTNMAGEPRDTVDFNEVRVPVAPTAAGIDLEAFRFRGALSRAALMAGAIEKMSQLTVSYTNDRVQFGRPVAKFQAVQQHLVWGAQDAALARMVAETAAREANRGAAQFEIAAAKLIANQAAARATKACHQAHGAMGMTQEYPLHHLSRRLWSWRKEYGGDAEWTKWLGQVAVSQGADQLYPLITGGSANFN